MLGSLIRVLILYSLVIFAIRLMGKRQVGEMQPSELVTTILISAVAAVPVQDLDIPLSHGVVPILTLLACELLLSAAGLKSPGLRKLLTGSPVTVVREGELVQGNLRRLRLSVDDVLEDLRLAGVWDLRTVALARVETNGRLSVLLRSGDSPVTAAQLGLQPPPAGIWYTLVSDGVVLWENLPHTGKSEAWLRGRMEKAGGARAIFLLCCSTGGEVLLAKKEESDG